MTDRELMELAAKAAGIELQPMEVKNVSHIGDDRFIGYMVSADKWPRGWFNPLADDGDALRLAVRLEIDILYRRVGGERVEVVAPSKNVKAEYCNQSTREAATRHAIVRAAAEIGKAMP